MKKDPTKMTVVSVNKTLFAEDYTAAVRVTKLQEFILFSSSSLSYYSNTGKPEQRLPLLQLVEGCKPCIVIKNISVSG